MLKMPYSSLMTALSAPRIPVNRTLKPLLIVLMALIFARAGSAAPGELVSSFGESGISATFYGNHNGECTAVSRLPGGHLLTGSTVQIGPSDYRVVVSKLQEDGSLDTSFGVDGAVLLPSITGATPQQASTVALLLRSDERITVAVAVPGGAAVRVLTMDGAVVPSLGFNYVSLPTGRLTCAILGSLDRLFLGGIQRATASASDDDGWVAQFHASGAINTGFSSSGKHTYGGSGNQGIHALAITRDNVLYIGGYTGNDAVIRRLSSINGALFSTPNTLTFRNTAVTSAYVTRAIHIDAIGRPVVVASTTLQQGHPFAARFRLNFTLDNTFGTAGLELLNSGGTGSYPQMERVIGTSLLEDDQLSVVGLVAQSAISTNVGSRLISKHGAADPAYGGGGWATHAPLRHSALAPACAKLPTHNGNLLIPGWLPAIDAPTNRQAVALVEAPLPQPIEALQVSVLADHFAVPNQTAVTYAVSATTSREGANLTYQWYTNSSLLSGQTSSHYSFTLNYTNENNAISVVVSDGIDSIRHWFTGTVFEPPVIVLNEEGKLYRPINATRSFSIPVAGRNPKTLNFYLGNTLERSVVVSTNEFAWAPAAGTEMGLLPVRITASNANGDTTWEGTLETLPDPSIVMKNENRLVEAGSDFEFPVEPVTTVTGMSFSLQKDGVNLPQGMSAGIPKLTNLQLSDAGTYQVRLGTTIGIVQSSPLRLCVVNDAERQALAAQGGMLQLNARAAGPGLSFEWFHDGQPLSDSANITGSAGSTLQISQVQTSSQGVYTCLVNSGTGPSKRAGHFTVRITQEPPLLQLLQLPPFHSGEYYHYQIPPDLLIGSISFKNLPPGITLNPDGNILSGSPTRPGAYNLLITATNPSGSVRNFEYPLTVNGVLDHLSGLNICDLSTIDVHAPEHSSHLKIELLTSDSGHFTAVIQYSHLRGSRKVFRRSGLLQPSTATSGNTLTKAILQLPRGSIEPGQQQFIRIYEQERLSGQPSLAATLETRGSGGESYVYFQKRFTRAWHHLPQEMPMLQGSYNLDLPKQKGLYTLEAPSVGRLSFTQARRALLTATLGDGSKLVASPVWLPDNGLYLNNLTHGNRSMTHLTMTYQKGLSPDDWDTVINARITKPGRLAKPTRWSIGNSFGFEWEGSGTRYLPPNVPFLSGPMPFNSRQNDPEYELRLGTNPYGSEGYTGVLNPNFTGSGNSLAQVRQIDNEGAEGDFTLPSTLKVNPRTGLISGRLWRVSIWRIEDDDSNFVRIKRSILRPSYSGLVVRDKNSTISRGNCQLFMPTLVEEYFTDANGNDKWYFIRTTGSNVVSILVRGQ
jgi:hypothetical protein